MVMFPSMSQTTTGSWLRQSMSLVFYNIFLPVDSPIGYPLSTLGDSEPWDDFECRLCFVDRQPAQEPEAERRLSRFYPSRILRRTRNCRQNALREEVQNKHTSEINRLEEKLTDVDGKRDELQQSLNSCKGLAVTFNVRLSRCLRKCQSHHCRASFLVDSPAGRSVIGRMGDKTKENGFKRACFEVQTERMRWIRGMEEAIQCERGKSQSSKESSKDTPSSHD